MRKILFFLILLPAVVALGHDIYMFSKTPEKGFRLSDVGSLWDRYHKESHDEWKVKLDEISDVVSDLNLSKEMPKSSSEEQSDVNDYSGSFTQVDQEGKGAYAATVKESISQKPSEAQKAVGFVLEQKAVFLFAVFAAIVYLLNAVFSLLFRGKKDMDKLGKLKSEGGSYKYGRK